MSMLFMRELKDNISWVNLVILYEFDKNEWSKPHTHDFLEIGYITAGNGIYNVNGRNLEMTAGDIIISLPGDPHYEHGIDKNNMEIIFIGISDYLYHNKKQTCPLSSMLLHTINAPDIFQLFKNIFIESFMHDNEYKYMIELYTSALLIKISRLFGKSEKKQLYSQSLPELLDMRNRSILLEIKNYIDENSDFNPENIEDLASRFFISSSFLMKIFKKATGYSIKHYIIVNKINKAIELLCNTTYNIEAISTLLGFSDIHYFYRIFKKYTGQTPKQYRTENKSKITEDLNISNIITPSYERKWFKVEKSD